MRRFSFGNNNNSPPKDPQDIVAKISNIDLSTENYLPKFNSKFALMSSSGSGKGFSGSSMKMIPTTMQDLIPTVNRLMDVFHTIHHAESLDLPQIVVVGSQSSGKSSVLENIVQKDFLPRGKDIVTRRPLVLQLVNLKAEGEQAQTEWAEFLHLPNQRVHDFNLVREEIERETERLAGTNRGIDRSPIHLKIFSTKVLNLTLVDLPGITKIPIGDQPPDIEVKIKKLVMEYVTKPNSIILAVSPANQDIVNSDALKLAREVDPEGRRTIGVLTKLDLMDAGTNASDILSNKAFPLRLGFVGIVNRSQQDIADKKCIKDALASEELFFRNHPAYRSISSKCGTAFLTKSLNQILMHHIREKLPELKSKLNLMIVQTEQELASYGDAGFIGKAHQGSLVLRLLTKFGNNFNASIDGTFVDISTSELSGGARLYYIFNSIFGSALDKIDPCSGLTAHDIRTAIRNSTGPRPSLFIPELAFDLLIKPQLKKLESPSVRCVELVFDELLKIVNSCETKEMSRFPKLHQKVVEVSIHLLRERMAPTQAYIESLISIQLAYINTNHPDFLGGSGAIAMLDKRQEKKRRDYERIRRHNPAILTSRASKEPGDGTVTDITIKPKDMIHPPPTGSLGQLHHHPGRDSGFLTYFFGNNPGNTSPEPLNINNHADSSRSSSPVRPVVERNADEYSLAPSTNTAVASAVSTVALSPPGLTEKEEMEVELISSLINSYFNITRKAIADLVPKTIMHLIVNYAKENIQNRLVTYLYREDLFAELLQEDERVMREREKCRELVEVYRSAAEILQDIF